ncbi:MAG: SHOCT domain-containing protein [Anaerolineae bacterium]|nr:SHOCT domain-containing protein [Anaerolineae bacterium]
MGLGLLVILVVILVYVLSDGGGAIRRWLKDETHSKSIADSNPLKILEMRLARGEIDIDEYTRLREELTGPE